MAAVEKAGYSASRITGGGRVQTAVGRAGNRGQGEGQCGDLPSGTCHLAENQDGGRQGTAREAVSAAGGGYVGTAPGRDSVQRKAAAQARAMKWRLGVSIGFLVPLMYVAMYHMYNEWFGLPIPGFVHRYFHGNENALTFALTQFLLLMPIVYMNRKFFAVGFRTLGHLSPNMDSLIALGASAAIVYGVFAMYRIGFGLGHGDMAVVAQYSQDLYFESAGI